MRKRERDKSWIKLWRKEREREKDKRKIVIICIMQQKNDIVIKNWGIKKRYANFDTFFLQWNRE